MTKDIHVAAKDKVWVKMVEEELNLTQESCALEQVPSLVDKHVEEEKGAFMNNLNKYGKEKVKDEVNNSNQNGFPQV